VATAVHEAVDSGWIDELGNGRFIRNVYEGACRQRDLRLFDVNMGHNRSPDNLELATIEATDVAAAAGDVLGPLRRRGRLGAIPGAAPAAGPALRVVGETG
jgi:hypothetical protein